MKIFKRIICSLLIVLSLSLVASAAYTTPKTVYFKKGNNFPAYSGCVASKKMTDNMYCIVHTDNRTSITAPRVGIIRDDNRTMDGLETALFSVINGGSVHRSFVSGVRGVTYNVVICGRETQIGTDTMTLKYDVDAAQ